MVRAFAHPEAAALEGAPDARDVRLRLIRDDEHYHELLCKYLPRARVSVWIATSNLKELRVEAPIGSRARARGRYVSILERLEGLAEGGVELRVLHGRAPSSAFQRELGRCRSLKNSLVHRLCPRVHLKLVIIDGRWLYLGSANFTGAGLGARSAQSRNFELGILTEDEYLLDQTQAHFEQIWTGRACGACRLRGECPKPLDSIVQSPTSPARSRRPIRRGRIA